MSKLSRFRSSQLASFSGAGLHIVSPQKVAPKRRARHQSATTCLDRERKRQRLQEELTRIDASLGSPPDPKAVSCPPEANDTFSCPPEADNTVALEVAEGSPGGQAEPGDWIDIDDGTTQKPDDTQAKSTPLKSKRISPDSTALVLHARWKSLLPTLMDPLLSYTSASICKPVQPVDGNLKGTCFKGSARCLTKDTSVVCLYFDHFRSINVAYCECESICQVLVRNGLFPTAPAQIRMAISIDLLDFYGALFERSCDAVNAMAAAMNSFYCLRGYQFTNRKEERFKEPFRRGLGYASQWLDVLRVMIEDRLDTILEQADEFIQSQRSSTPNAQSLPSSSLLSVPTPQSISTEPSTLPRAAPTVTCDQAICPPTPAQIPSFTPCIGKTPAESYHQQTEKVFEGMSTLSSDPITSDSSTECSRRLRQLCPACFGGKQFGTVLEDGGDFHVATDGNFHHRHLISGGASVPFYDAKHIIPKTFVDAVGDHISKARKSRPKKRTPKVPDCAVDECEKSHEAADGDKKKSAHEGRYDDMGWMSLVCRHDIPLFFANIDTPGEQQKYSFALILWLFFFIPREATVTVLYDVGCVADQSISLFDILPPDVVARLQFVTTAMHAYRHQWSCQLAYNPRLSKGLGLTDGEGVERIWSRLRRLIPIVRTSSRAKRQYLTDRQLSRIAREGRTDLGDWIKRRQRLGVQGQGRKAKDIMLRSGIKESELRAQWDLQKAAQLSLRAHAPARVRKELDTILSLQGDVEMIDKAIGAMESSLQASTSSVQSKKILEGLRDSRRMLTNNLEALYVSLNVCDEFPDLKGVNLEFLHTLFMARDLKINIRKRAVGSFFEWSRLDQAVGGRNQALGTKLYQQTRKAIAKRTPALTTAIKKFNRYCMRLADLYEPAWNIPVPLPLPTKLADLRDDSSLMEDVWVSPCDTKSQPWLNDPDVRSGIRAMLKVDRCTEEQRRLGRESDNLCSWFGREIAAVELAIRTPQCATFAVQLAQRRDELLHLKSRWMSPLASAIRFDAHVEAAVRDAARLTGHHVAAPLRWVILTADIEGVRNLRHDVQSQALSFENSEEDEHPGGEDIGEEEDDGPLVDEDASEIIVSDILQADEDDVEETSDIQYSEDAMILQAGTLHLREDEKFADLIYKKIPMVPGDELYRRRGFGPFVFDEKDLQVFDAPDALLTDVCLNGSAGILQDIFIRDPQNGLFAQRCAIFSTHDLNRIHYSAADSDLWRNTCRLQFWEKDVWIVPIHRKSQRHWVLAVIYLQSREVHLFDSLALSSSWMSDMKNISVLISRLVELARRSGHMIAVPTDGWVAKTATVHAVQTNGYDCGLWVLAWIASILRGFEIPADNLSENTFPHAADHHQRGTCETTLRQFANREITMSYYFDRIKASVLKNAKQDCIEYAAPYFLQACSEGRVNDFFAAVEKLYKDRWPNDPEFSSGLFRTSLMFVSVAAMRLGAPETHWELAMSVAYDRIHRPTLREFCRTHGFDDFVWPYADEAPEDDREGNASGRSTANTVQEDPGHSEENTRSASEGEDNWSDNEGTTYIDFFSPLDLDEAFGEDAHLFGPLDREPIIIPVRGSPSP